MCPWAWITSRRVAEVAEQSSYTVDWRFICLRLLNEEKQYGKDFPEGYIAGHGTGLKLLRVAAAIRDAEGPDRMGGLYTQWVATSTCAAGVTRSSGSTRRVSPTTCDRWASRTATSQRRTTTRGTTCCSPAERDEALALTGKDVGTPISPTTVTV